jgi:flagellar basal-body rod protein FlgG
MLDSLYIAATGMNAQQMGIDTISNNLANVNTPAFKKGRVGFSDLMYRELARANGLAGSADNTMRSGVGVGITGMSKLFTAGELKKTEAPLDLAIRGRGFFEVTLADGTHAYTRAGALQIDKDGLLATAEGHVLDPSIRIPDDAASVTIEAGGRVLAVVPDEKDPVEVGVLQLADFVNPGGLQPQGDNLYLPTEKSGDAFTGKPGEANFGSLAQGFLESSNVKLIEEFINLIVAQRAYEVSAKAIQASDEMLGIANNLRR